MFTVLEISHTFIELFFFLSIVKQKLRSELIYFSILPNFNVQSWPYV